MAAAAVVRSCFSAAAAPCIRSKCLPFDNLLKVTYLAKFPISPATTIPFSHLLEPLSINVVSHMRFPSRVFTAVAEEGVAAIETESGEEAKEEGVSEGGEVEGEPLNTKLYFGNLPYNVDSSLLAGIIQEYGSPEMVEVLYDRDTGRSRGFAFVTMSSVKDCDAVIKNLDGSGVDFLPRRAAGISNRVWSSCGRTGPADVKDYGGRTLRVNFSDKPKVKEPLYPETEFKIFVGNLSWSVTSESLTQVFQEYGNVVGARVLYDGDTGRSRGYGFVCYSTKEEMDAALDNLDGVELDGRAMRVSPALGKRS